MAEEWVLRGSSTAYELSIDRAWANVTAEWADVGIPFDPARGYALQILDVSDDRLSEAIDESMTAQSADPSRLRAPATVFRAELDGGLIDFTFACWDLMPDGW